MPRLNRRRIIPSTWSRAASPDRERPASRQFGNGIPRSAGLHGKSSSQFGFDGRYTFTAKAADLGHFEAREGKWKAASDISDNRAEGGYSFVGDDSLVMAGTLRGAVPTVPQAIHCGNESEACRLRPLRASPPSLPSPRLRLPHGRRRGARFITRSLHRDSHPCANAVTVGDRDPKKPADNGNRQEISSLP